LRVFRFGIFFVRYFTTADDKEEVKVKEVKKSAREITNTKSMGSYFPQESTRQQAQNKGKPTLIISGYE
jgi:hypothetical protein